MKNRCILPVIIVVLFIFGGTAFSADENIVEFSSGSIQLPLGVKEIPTEVEKLYGDRKEKLGDLLNKEEEVQKVDSIKEAIHEVEIKQNLNNELFNDFKSQIDSLKKDILSNEKVIADLEASKKRNAESEIELKKIKNTNANFKKQLAYKELIILDLEKSIDNLNVLKTKYDNILLKYVDIKKDKDLEKEEEFQNKMKVLYTVLFISILLYIIKYFLRKKFLPKYETKFLYFDLIHGVVLISFLIGFFFYIFPQLYILLIFISGSLIFVNASLISSFISSLIVFRKYKIGDVILHDEKIGRIRKITPLFTTMRILNKYGVISNDIESIPNILLIKDKVMIIGEPTLIDHEFSIALSLKTADNIFKIIDEIKVHVLAKNLNQRIANINPEDEETFKIFHEQSDPDFVKIHFIWRASPNRSRKLEAKIISYVNNYINQYQQEQKSEESIGAEVGDNLVKT